MCAFLLAAALFAGEPRPNIVVLFADDLRFDAIGAFGNDEVKTPHLDALARRGTAFTHCFNMGSMNPAVCMPSRAMLMSGRTL
ncbi:MAG: sulfatase-like hydrolase/transferase, partial [Pirellulaceae bacterium]|nr:sulfatase-like hydrolase/transferase [Pirellulaceae bacterium]